MANTSMRGLTQYIADLRACRVRELEEKRINREMAHIRQKFKEANLDGYQKKKYLAKIIFTYILGYQVDIGHMEAVNLISSQKYSEKQIGYLALTLLMHENSDIVRLVVNSIRKDLDDMNEVNNCLALHAIANIGGREMAESLADDVHRLLISPTSRTFVKKKAALTTLRLYRKHPDVIPAEEWALRIVSIMDDQDLGVCLAVTSLVMTLAQDHLDAYAVCYQKAVNRLNKIVIEEDYTVDYLYYKIPNPWLQVKLLRLLQYYPPSDDPTNKMILHNVLQTILTNSQDTPKNVQHNNAQNAVLFEAINLAIHLDAGSTIVEHAARLLGRFILSRETNVRYLGLDTMAHLAACTDSLEPIKKHQDTIILSLRDKDISVRRRGLDLLYSMCDVTNAKVIVGELLKYLQVADYALREEMVLKIAILTEKFATEYEWYVDTILQLISTAGDHVGEEVWYRIVQIVTNTEELQEYAAGKVFDYLRRQTCHEIMIKLSAYILGEFGHLIANNPGSSPIEQFHALHSKSHLCSSATRAILLSTYIKWVNIFPEIKDRIIYVFDRYRHVLDAELQQRACEYAAVAQMADDELLATMCEEMPAFPERESAILSRLNRKHGDTEDKRTWIIGGKDVNKSQDAVRFKSMRKTTLPDMAAPRSPAEAPPPLPSPRPPGANGGTANGNGSATDDIMAGLMGLDMSAPALSPTATATAAASGGDGKPAVMVSPAPSPSVNGAFPGSPPITHGMEKYYQRLCFNSEGVLFEDSQLQIGMKSEYHGHHGRIALYLGNKITATFTSFTATIDVLNSHALSITFPKIPTTTISGMTQIQQIVQVECKDFFTADPSPVLSVSYLAGSHQTINLRLPVVLSKFIEPVTLTPADFFERWKQIGGAPLEAQAIFPIRLKGGEVDTVRNRRVIAGCRLQVLEGIDPNPINLVGAGVLHMSTAGKVGCLVRFEPNKEAKLCRVTVRTTNDAVSQELLDAIRTPLSPETMAT